MPQVRRRSFVLTSAALLSAPLRALAQQGGKVRRIGILSPDSPDSRVGQDLRRNFPNTLRKLGYDDGRNLAIEWRWGNGRTDTLPALAQELVRLDVGLIVARTNGPILAAKNATGTIPIVMFNGNFPVESGLIQSLSRPGGNITGTSYISAGFFGKQLQVLKDLAPNVDRIAILWAESATRAGVTGKAIADSIEHAAKRLAFTPHYFEVATPAEIGGTLERIAASGVNALHSSGNPILRQNQKEITAFAVNRKLPSIGIAGFADDGALADYSPDPTSFFERTASYVDRILRGAKPADLPVEEPTKFNLVINLKTAKTIGLTIPQSVLLRADRVIE